MHSLINKTDTTSTHTNRQDRISETKVHILHFTKFARQHKLPHSSPLIKNQTSYSAKLLAQRKVTTAQPSVQKQTSKSFYQSTFTFIYLTRHCSSTHHTRPKTQKNSSSGSPQPPVIPQTPLFSLHQILLFSSIYLFA